MADFVLDASLAMAWCFKDEQTDFTQGVLSRLESGENAIAPTLSELV